MNRGIKVLQTLALPLGYGTACLTIMQSRRHFVKWAQSLGLEADNQPGSIPWKESLLHSFTLQASFLEHIIDPVLSYGDYFVNVLLISVTLKVLLYLELILTITSSHQYTAAPSTLSPSIHLPGSLTRRRIRRCLFGTA